MLARALLVVMLVVAPAALTGCVTGGDGSVRMTPYLGLVEAEPGRATEFAVLVENRGAFRDTLALGAEGLPHNWTVHARPNATVTVDGGGQRPVVFVLTPGEEAEYGTTVIRLRAGAGAVDVVVDVADLGPERARRGVGAHVFTVGYWDNGTIFYTNMKEVRDNLRLPWHPMSDDARSDASMVAIKAYVGGERGTPAPEPYNQSGYVPLIAGFDERLRLGNGGMRAGETLAVHLPPEKAYTMQGNESHPLYGDPLNFVIRVESVDVLRPEPVLPCPPGAPVCPPG